MIRIDPARARTIYYLASGVTLLAILGIAAIGLLLTLRLQGDIREDQAILRDIVTQSQRLEEQHEAETTAAQARVQTALDDLGVILDERLADLLRDIHALRFEIDDASGQTTIIQRGSSAPQSTPQPTKRRGKKWNG